MMVMRGVTGPISVITIPNTPPIVSDIPNQTVKVNQQRISLI